MRLLLLTAALISVFALPRLHGQAAPTFETASVKPNDSRDARRGGSLAGGRFAMTYSTLRELIVFAYPRQNGTPRLEAEITGGPSWINADHFDVVAKAPEGQGVGIDVGNTGAGGATSADLAGIRRIRAMAQTLLVDRFKLAVHNEVRELPAYEVRMDRSDGRLGPQLKKLDVDCTSQRGSGAAPCRGFRTIAPGHVVAHAVTMFMFAEFLQMPVSRNVFDRTGLQGTFDMEIQYTPDRQQLRTPDAPAADPAGVSVFTAVREQLGLRLEPTKAPVDVLVIDRAEKPTPD
jgi:uncharacterized protein (TIGR03435 family)